MDYNVGDRILCKKKKGDISLNKYYTISEIKNLDKIWLKGDNNSLLWSTDKTIKNNFYTKVEIRKFKLEKLQCIK